MRRLLVLIALLVSACESIISLGSECAKASGGCPDAASRDEDAEASDDASFVEDLDAGSTTPGGKDSSVESDGSTAGDAGQERDATQMRDAAQDEAGLVLFPDFIRNPSFESDGAVSTDLAGFDFGIGYAPPSQVPPWRSCRPGPNTRVQTSKTGGPDRATEGSTFLSYSLSLEIPVFNGVPILNGVAQDLSQPLRQGQQYGFAIDVWAENLNAASPALKVGSGNLDCYVGTVLGGSLPLSTFTDSWNKVCLSFTPKQDVHTIILFVDTGALSVNSFLHIDNIRPDPACRN